MDSKAAFSFINNLLLQKTREGLNECEQDVILGIWEGKTYQEISDENNLSFPYLKEIGSKLFKKIGGILGIKVSKTTFKPTIEQFWQQQQSVEQASCLSNVRVVSNVRVEEVVRSQDSPTVSCDRLITNPFLPLSGIVDDPELFFDRNSETREIFTLLNSGSSVALIGERAIGKSSLP